MAAVRRSDRSRYPARNTRAVASFLRAVQFDKVRLDHKSVVVVDEISMLGTRQLNDILIAQKRYRFQLVMIDDPKQMQSVEAGPVIGLLRRALGEDSVPELSSSVRQRDAEERETALMLRNGQTAEAINRKEANGTLRIVPSGYREALVHIAELWEQRRAANHDRPGFTISVSAPTNAEAHDISLAIRERRRILGEIGQDKIAIDATDGEAVRSHELALAVGDRIRLFKRTDAKFTGTATVGNIGRNGTVLEVAGVAEDGLILRSPAGKEGLVAWSTLKHEPSSKVQLAYGDALTTNTAQGTTVTEHIHAIPAGPRLVSAFGAYTSGSRHREQSFIVTSEGAERAEIIGRRPLGDRREIMRDDILSNITRNFAQQPQKESALDMIDRAANLRRGTIRMVQASLQSMEARVAAQERPTNLPKRFANRRINDVLEERLPGLAEHLRRHGETMTRIARAAAERLAAIARRRSAKHQTEAEYWQRTREKAAPMHEQAEACQRRRKNVPDGGVIVYQSG